MNLKYCTFIIGLLALFTEQTAGAATVSQPKSFNWGLTGVPTPLEEYGLTLGDITTSRIFNPIGQLKNNDSIIVARQLKKIVNPWQELTPGTGLIVDGKKAVIRQIQPETPPSDEEAGLRIKLTVQEIAGTTMTLEWEQVSHKLNWAETAPARETTVEMLKQNLRVGTHLIINGNRSVITRKSLGYSSPTSTKNKDLQFTAHYYALEGSKGTLSGKPNSTENLTDAAWKLKDGLFNLANNTVQLATWKFRSRDGDPDIIPTVTVLHRARGIVSDIELLNDKFAEIHILSTHNGQIYTHQLSWEQTMDEVKQGSPWQLKSTLDDFVEVHRVNDSNIQFNITPKSLIEANQEAAKFFERKKHNTGGNNLSSNILDAETIANQITNLEKIVNSDASETIKIDAKRQALIYLARFYEHQADLIKALEQEYLYRAEIKLKEARKYERHAWLADQKMKFLVEKNTSLTDLIGTQIELNPKIDDLDITEAYEQLEEYTDATLPELNGNSLEIEYARLKGNNEAYKKEANHLRTEVGKISKDDQNRAQNKQQAKKNYDLALHFWSEYIYRTEGLKEGARKLGESGIDGNTLPSDPYLPEILLRQAWIYRQMSLTDRAISTYYDVLTGATKQKIDNLTRFGRIALVARSQIANCFYEDAEDAEDLSEAINLYRRLLPSDNEDSNNEELDNSQVELKLLRALFRANDQARKDTRRLERTFEQLLKRMATKEKLDRDAFEKAKKSGKYESKKEEEFAEQQLREQEKLNKELARAERQKFEGKVAIIEQNRTKNWKLLKSHTEQFIERYAKTEPDLRHDGEVRYYKILANKSLDNQQHVQRDMEILLDDSSTPDQLRQAWLATRVRVIIDVSNLLYSEAIRKEEERALGPKLNDTEHALSEYLEQAIKGYHYALDYDQTYRSQIMLRQQIAFCQERLKQNLDAIKTYETTLSLCSMHPHDLTPTLKVVQKMANLKLHNLRDKENQRSRANNKN